MKKYGIEHFHIEQLEECVVDLEEEREKYWIEQYNSFKEGYNATLGGDGKPYIDYQTIIDIYSTVHSQRETAHILGICEDTVREVLKNYSFMWEKGRWQKEIARKVKCLEENKIFSCAGEAADWIIEKRELAGSRKTIQSHINEVCNGKRKSAYGYVWQYS